MHSVLSSVVSNLYQLTHFYCIQTKSVMKYEIKKSVLNLYQKNYSPTSCDMWVNSEPCRFKTKSGFRQAVLKHIEGLKIPSRIETLLFPTNPLEASRTFYHLDLMSPVPKCNDCTAALFFAGMENIYKSFLLKHGYIYIF